jgi:hypothetical protein
MLLQMAFHLQADVQLSIIQLTYASKSEKNLWDRLSFSCIILRVLLRAVITFNAFFDEWVNNNSN